MREKNQEISSTVEDGVRDFYERYGWVEREGVSGEDRSFRIFRPSYYPYHEEVERRTLAAFEPFGGSLLIAGCGDMPDSHVDLARRFDETVCADISRRALSLAARRLDGAADMLHCSVLDLPVADARFDAVFSAHVIYHIDIRLQERAVRELIRVTKPGGRIVIIYSNPHSPLRYLASLSNRAGKIRRSLAGSRPQEGYSDDRPELYFMRHPISWWRRFEDRCRVDIRPWDVIGSAEERALIWSDNVARRFYGAARWLEASCPRLAVRLWQYPMIVLNKG